MTRKQTADCSSGEGVPDKLLPITERDRARQGRLHELRRKIAEGLDAARRGDVVDGEEVLAEIRRRSADRRGN